jgi:hypothetical protein
MRSDKDSFGEFVDNVFYAKQDSGFFSICSLVLFELSRGPSSIQRVDASEVFSYYSPKGVDAWPLFFENQPDVIIRDSNRNPFARRRRNHSVYSNLPIFRARKHLIKFFTPSTEVLDKTRALIRKYSIEPNNTLVICYRGTDKSTEITPEPVGDYISEAKKVLKKHAGLRVLIQTDQEQVKQTLLQEFGPSAFFIEEMPTTTGATVIHKLIARDRRIDFGQTLLATVLIMALSKYVISHTGNMSLWIALFRGNTRRFTQMGAHRFATPARPIPQILLRHYWLNRLLNRRNFGSIQKLARK